MNLKTAEADLDFMWSVPGKYDALSVNDISFTLLTHFIS